MLLSAVSVLVVAQSSSEIPQGLMNNPVYSSCVLTYLSLLVITERGSANDWTKFGDRIRKLFRSVFI